MNSHSPSLNLSDLSLGGILDDPVITPSRYLGLKLFDMFNSATGLRLDPKVHGCCFKGLQQ